jgi:hypothetical protein
MQSCAQFSQEETTWEATWCVQILSIGCQIFSQQITPSGIYILCKPLYIEYS